MTEKYVFIPSGSVIAAVGKGLQAKEAIEFHGHDAGEVVPLSQLSEIDKKLIMKLEEEEFHENKT